MLTVPSATTARALRPRDVAAGALLSVGFVVATAVVSGDGGPSAGTRYVDPPVPGGSTAPEVPGGPGVRLSDVTGAGSGETTSPSGTADPGPLAAVTEPLLEPLAPVVQTAEPVIETLAEPVTEVAAQDDY